MVFLEPPSWEELVSRLSGRGTDSEEDVRRRLETARAELAAKDEFDVAVVNSDLRVVVGQLVSLLSGAPISEAAGSIPEHKSAAGVPE